MYPGGCGQLSVIIVLGLIWAAVLVPPVLRSRAERRAEFIDSFREQMGALDTRRTAAGARAQAGGRAAEGARGARRRATPQQRRRDILGGLLGAMAGSLVLGAIPSLRMVWVLHLFLLNAFIGYCSLLAYQRHHRGALTRVRAARAEAPTAEAAPRPRTEAAPRRRRFTPAFDPAS